MNCHYAGRGIPPGEKVMLSMHLAELYGVETSLKYIHLNSFVNINVKKRK